VLPENATLYFFTKLPQRQGGQGNNYTQYYTQHDWSYGEIIVPDLSLELFEWSANASGRQTRLPLDMAQAFRVDIQGNYFAEASRGCLHEGSAVDSVQPAHQFFSWGQNDCDELVRIAQQSQKLLPEFVPKLKTVDQQGHPHQGEQGSESVRRYGEEQQSAPENQEKTHGRMKETLSAMSTYSDAGNWFWSWGWWIVFGLILLGGLILITWLWRVQKRRRETTPTIREIRYAAPMSRSRA
jgi:hypothetical protein